MKRLNYEQIITTRLRLIVRRICQIIIGHVNFHEITAIFAEAYVEAAELKIKADGGRVTLANIAVHTGIDTRNIKKIKKQLNEKELDLDSAGLPESRLLSYWATSKDYTEQKTGKPLELPLVVAGSSPQGSASFQGLVNSVFGRNVTYGPLLDLLVTTKNIVMVNENKIRLKNRIFEPKDTDAIQNVQVSLHGITNLTGTILNNAQHRGEGKLLQQQRWLNRSVRAEDLGSYQKALNKLLRRQIQNVDNLLLKYEKPHEDKSGGAVNIGVGWYVFKEKTEPFTKS